MNIVVLGANGMLGRYVYTYLKNGLKEATVIPITRQDFEIDLDTNYTQISNFFDDLQFGENTVLINCMGLIKPQVDKYGVALSIMVNSLFPQLLSQYCDTNNRKLIHVTTDCVFSGKKGNYIETDPHDVTDIYGRTKSLGEPSSCTVIRTSIIGEELTGKRSLLEWVKSNAGKEINGFEDHVWNGITCLQFAKCIQQIINKNTFWKGVKHVYSNPVTKYELLHIINEVYNLNIKINKTISGSLCDRTLSSLEYLYLENFSSDLKTQIIDMKEYQNLLQ